MPNDKANDETSTAMPAARAIALAIALAAIATSAPASAQSDEKIAEAIVERTNAFRKEEGLGTLESNGALRETAKAFACYMARTGTFSHTADSRQPWERARSNGFPTKCVAENIAMRQGYGRSTLAEGFTQGWIDSPGHRLNMLAPGAKVTGVGLCESNDQKVYAVQLIGAQQLKSLEVANVGRSGTLDYSIRYAEPTGHRKWGEAEETGDIGPGGWARVAFCWSGTLRLSAGGKQLTKEEIDGQKKLEWRLSDGRWEETRSSSASAQ